MVMTPTHAQLAERCAELLALDEKRTPGDWKLARSDDCLILDKTTMQYPVACTSFNYETRWEAEEANAAFLVQAPRMAQCIRELLEALREAEAAKLSTRLIENVDKSFEYDASERGWRPIVTVEFALTQCDLDSESWTARDAFAKAIDAALNPEAKT